MSELRDLGTKGANFLTDGFKKSRDYIQQALHSDDYDMSMPNEMRYGVKDNTFRDIYERGNEKEGSYKGFAFLMGLLGVALILMVGVVFIPMIGGMVTGEGYFPALLGFYFWPPAHLIKLLVLIGITVAAYVALKIFGRTYWESQHVDTSAELKKQYKDDSRIQQPEELLEHYNAFPDGQAHSHHIQVTAILGHIMFNNDGLNDIQMPMRADGKGTYDDPDDPANKHVLLYDENDEISMVSRPMIDEKFGDDLWTSAGIPKLDDMPPKEANYFRNHVRVRYSPNRLLYNPNHTFGKPDVRLVSDWINQDWYMPKYEVQRPAGAYVVDTEPNNTMVLAMTRAGKGDELSLVA